MKNKENPFLVKGYVNKELFCDRENEIESLLRNVENGLDTTLLAPRRMGKTGLIFRFFDELETRNPDINAIYVDIFATRSLNDFVKFLAEAILKKYPEKTGFGSKFLRFLKGLRPLISYDPLSGEPQVQILYQTPQEKEYSLKGLLDFLDNQGRNIVIAIDEFQQITEYPEQNIEALLRTYIQQLRHTHFIFCGSRTNMMLNIFSNAKRPFFSSTQYLHLDKIDHDTYKNFIRDTFERYKMSITEEALEFILEWTSGHTFYTQSLCNMVFSMKQKQIGIQTVREACRQILKQSEPVFLQYRQMLTSAQWNFLIAIGKEGSVEHITAKDFIAKYEIGTPANARRIAQSLVEKELLLKEITRDAKTRTTYKVYDIFMSRWLQSTY